jgi:hypothetical protein
MHKTLTSRELMSIVVADCCGCAEVVKLCESEGNLAEYSKYSNDVYDHQRLAQYDITWLTSPARLTQCSHYIPSTSFDFICSRSNKLYEPMSRLLRSISDEDISGWFWWRRMLVSIPMVLVGR